MSGASGGNEEFEEQLRLQQLYGEQGPGEQQHTFEDPSDGTIYEWDHDRNGWFPKITEDFLALYHANYGVPVDDVPSTTEPASQTDSKPAKTPKVAGEKKQPTKGPDTTEDPTAEPKPKAEKRKPDPGWFNLEEDRNTNVYVTGLPPDITDDEFLELMSKYGIIMRDIQTEDYKIKLYKDQEGNLKGDGRCCYLKRESVDLALKFLDEYEIRGYKLHVEVAKFELKGEYDVKKKRKRSKDYRKKLNMQQKLLDWRPEKNPGENRLRHERVIIIRNMFHPSDFEEDPLVLNEIREDLRTECEKFGQVKKVLIFDRHPDGVASIAFKETEEADLCIAALHGRWFGGRQLSVETWDGVTDYQIEETSREREERLKGWDSFLGDEPGVNKKDVAPAASTVPDSPAASVPESAAAAVVDSPAVTVPESAAAAVVDSPAVSVPDASTAATVETPSGIQHSIDECIAEGDVTSNLNVHENNGEHNHEVEAQSTDSSLIASEDEEEQQHV